MNLKNPFLKSKWIGTPLKPEYMKQITGLAGIATATLLPLSILSKFNSKSQSLNTYEKQEEIKIESSSDDYCKMIDKYEKTLSDYEWNKMCSSIEEDWGCSFEELYNTDPELTEEFIIQSISAKRYQEFFSNAVPFDAYKLSLHEINKLQTAIKGYSVSDVVEILRKNNAEIFEKLGGNAIFDDVSFQSYINTLCEQLEEIDKKNTKEIDLQSTKGIRIVINGVEKFFDCKIKPMTNNHKINYEALLKSNMITSLAVQVAKHSGVDFNFEQEMRFVLPNGSVKKIRVNVKDIVDKLSLQGYESLTTHETHILTDVLTELYCGEKYQNQVFAKNLEKEIEPKAREIYNYVNPIRTALKEKTKTCKTDINIEFDDHFILRMLDRNYMEILNNDAIIKEVIDIIEDKAKDKSDKGQSEITINYLGEKIKCKIRKESEKNFILETII